MPKLWNETIESHRQAVRDATIDATATLVRQRGLPAVTMSRIAKETGIGRATLYKYFPDVEAILVAWHERQVADHLAHLVEVRDKIAGPARQLEAVLQAYAKSSQEGYGTEVGALLHRGEHVTQAHRHLQGFIEEILAQGVEAGEVRDDVSPAELARYCLHALGAAGEATSRPAVKRLVAVTLSGLQPDREAPAT